MILDIAIENQQLTNLQKISIKLTSQNIILEEFYSKNLKPKLKLSPIPVLVPLKNLL